MDITKKNIEMCRKATEIQELWKPFIGDYYVWNDSVTILSSEMIKNHTSLEVRDKRCWGWKQYSKYIYGYYEDWVLMNFNNECDCCDDCIKLFQEIFTGYSNCHWLPRQDQLQKMILEVVDYETTALLESKFHKFLTWLDEWDFTSMEQLWLAFVMHEKYNKHWNGKDWE